MAPSGARTVFASIFITGSLRWYGTRPADLQPQLYGESGGDAPTPTAVNLLTAEKNSAGRTSVWAKSSSGGLPPLDGLCAFAKTWIDEFRDSSGV
jgi:hypothetical protein